MIKKEKKSEFPILPHTFWIRISSLHPPTFCLLQTLWPRANSHSWNHFPINVQQLSPPLPLQLRLEALLGKKKNALQNIPAPRNLHGSPFSVLVYTVRLK